MLPKLYHISFKLPIFLKKLILSANFIYQNAERTFQLSMYQCIKTIDVPKKSYFILCFSPDKEICSFFLFASSVHSNAIFPSNNSRRNSVIFFFFLRKSSRDKNHCTFPSIFIERLSFCASTSYVRVLTEPHGVHVRLTSILV